jgi:hypothetical protein
VCFKHLFFVDVESNNQSMSHAASLGSFCVFFLGLLSSLKRCLFFSVDFIDVNKDVCDTTDSDDGDDDGNDEDEKSVDNRLDTVDPEDGDNFTRGSFNNLDNFFFSSMIERNNLPCLIFVGVSKIGLGFAIV